MSSQNCFRFTLTNSWDSRVIEIEAIHHEVDQKTYEHTFQVDKGGYIVELCYHSRNWDLTDVNKTK
jgi:hypothetical protein